MKKNKVKNNLDEMQEQKLLQIERNGCWFVFWALLISLFVQYIIYDDINFAYVAGEWIVFMCHSVYLGIACLKEGIWDRHYKADTTTNLKFSLAGALGMGVLMGVKVYQRSGMLGGSIASGFIAAAFTFVICFVLLIISAAVYKKRTDELETEELEEADNE